MDSATTAFFKRLKELDAANNRCIDCGSANPPWASVSHGIFVCLECIGKHRGLGVHISFTRSTTMDTWNPPQKSIMEIGGNSKCEKFFEEHGIKSYPIETKYRTVAAANYRKRLKAESEGSAPPPPPPIGTGHLMEGVEQNPLNPPLRGPSPVPGDAQDGGSGFNGDAASSGYHSGGRSGGFYGSTSNMSGFGNPNFPQSQPRPSQSTWGDSLSGWMHTAQDTAKEAYSTAQQSGYYESMKNYAGAAGAWASEKSKKAAEVARDENFWNTAKNSLSRSYTTINEKVTGVASSASMWWDDSPFQHEDGEHGGYGGLGNHGAQPPRNGPMGPNGATESAAGPSTTSSSSNGVTVPTSAVNQMPAATGTDPPTPNFSDDADWNAADFKKGTIR
eukprot:Selendium_serpulae@DN6109_c2_g3_i7.p1